jgi:putative membrane protein
MLIATVLADSNDHMMGGDGSWWVWGPVMTVLVLAVIGVVVWLIIRNGHHGGDEPSRSPRDILGERFARGEINSDEYEERLSKLR